MYILEGVFIKFRLRRQCPNHAHDIYDAFQGIHATQVRNSTYFSLEEMIDIIKKAHAISNAKGQARPLMGHDVKVSALWDLRDFWEWLAPGYNEKRTRAEALKKAAFVSYSNLRDYHDWLFQLEEGSTPANPRVGLWAKRLMSDPTYKYIGTVITKEMVDNVIKDRAPPPQQRDISEQKTTREKKVLTALVRATKGPHKKQLSEARLADAIAMCKREWGHFADCSGKLPPNARWLPAELGAEMRRQGLRRDPGQVSEVLEVPGVAREQSEVEQLLTKRGPGGCPPAQKLHYAATAQRLSRGKGVGIVATDGADAPTMEEFAARPIVDGSFVITRGAPHSHWARRSEVLRELPFWVWRVLLILPAGCPVPGFRKPAAGHVYLAQVYHPACKGNRNGAWRPTWDVGTTYLRTQAEKTKHNRRKGRAKAKGHTRWQPGPLAQRMARGLSLRPPRPAVASSSRPPAVTDGSMLIDLQHPPRQRAASSSSSSSSASSEPAPVRLRTKRPRASGSVAQSLIKDEESEKFPLQAYLRPENVVGGVFLRTPTGCLPKYVQDYWQQVSSLRS